MLQIYHTKIKHKINLMVLSYFIAHFMKLSNYTIWINNWHNKFRLKVTSLIGIIFSGELVFHLLNQIHVDSSLVLIYQIKINNGLRKEFCYPYLWAISVNLFTINFLSIIQFFVWYFGRFYSLLVKLLFIIFHYIFLNEYLVHPIIGETIGNI